MKEEASTMLTVKDLKIEFHDKDKPQIGVEHVSFEVTDGEIVGIVGESGSGKSITALSIAGLINRSDVILSGSIKLDDRELLGMSRKELRKIQGSEIGMVFQDPLSSLNPVKKIGWQVEESLRVHGEDDLYLRAIKALEDAGLEDARDIYEMYPHELSGGMRQRVMIAAAIISNPSLLICDEPTTALDVVTQGKILKLLKSINKEKNTSILFISHDLRVVKMICTKIMVMKDGHIVEIGDAKEIFESPKEEYTKSLLKYSFGEETLE